MMTSPADTYRKNADDCIQLAEHSLKPSDKECLLKFAQQWLQLAQEANQAER